MIIQKHCLLDKHLKEFEHRISKNINKKRSRGKSTINSKPYYNYIKSNTVQNRKPNSFVEPLANNDKLFKHIEKFSESEFTNTIANNKPNSEIQTVFDKNIDSLTLEPIIYSEQQLYLNTHKNNNLVNADKTIIKGSTFTTANSDSTSVIEINKAIYNEEYNNDNITSTTINDNKTSLSKIIYDGNTNEGKSFNQKNELQEDSIIKQNSLRSFKVNTNDSTINHKNNNCFITPKDSIALKNASVVSINNIDTLNKKHNTKSTTITNRFLFGLNFTPEYSYRFLKGTDPEGITIANERNNIESSKFSYSFGANFGYYISRRILIGTGIQYLNIGEKITDKNDLYNGHNNYNFIGTSFQLGYILMDNTFGLIINSGISTYVLLSANNHIENPTNNNNSYTSSIDDNSDNYSKLSLAYSGSLGFSYKTSKRLSFYTGPTFKYFLTSIYQKDFSLLQKPYSIGLQIGCIYHL